MLNTLASFLDEGNMILIKDRHMYLNYQQLLVQLSGKYDTYKGSTPYNISHPLRTELQGKYDTYKGLCVWCNMLLI